MLHEFKHQAPKDMEVSSVKYTELERIVFNALIDICMDAPEADVNDLSRYTDLPKDTVKGVVGSLKKKSVIEVGSERRDYRVFQTINPIINGDLLCFGCDHFDSSEVEKFKV